MSVKDKMSNLKKSQRLVIDEMKELAAKITGNYAKSAASLKRGHSAIDDSLEEELKTKNNSKDVKRQRSEAKEAKATETYALDEFNQAQLTLAKSALLFFLNESDPIVSLYDEYNGPMTARWAKWLCEPIPGTGSQSFVRCVCLVLGGITVRSTMDAAMKLDHTSVAAALVYAFVDRCENDDDAFLELQLVLHWIVTGSLGGFFPKGVLAKLKTFLHDHDEMKEASKLYALVFTVLRFGLSLLSFEHSPQGSKTLEMSKALENDNYKIDTGVITVSIRLRFPDFLDACPYVHGTCTEYGFPEPNEDPITVDVEDEKGQQAPFEMFSQSGF